MVKAALPIVNDMQKKKTALRFFDMKGVETFYFEIYIPFYVYLQQYLM
jgi:hypothetical protein